MMKKYVSGYPAIIISGLVFFAVIVSIRYLDAIIAERVWYILRSIRPLHQATQNIPDILPDIVWIGTPLMWGMYFYFRHKKKNYEKTHFLLLAGTALPVSYIVKTVFKFLFGRTNTRKWLMWHRPLAFHWFHKFGGSFPSGHMTVFAAFGAAILIYFPQYRKPVLILLLLLGLALIGTDYHFLSDVIAGAYLGFATTISLQFMFEKFTGNK